MKSFSEIKKEIAKQAENTKAAEAKAAAIHEKIKAGADFAARMAARKEYAAELAALEASAKAARLAGALLKNNAKLAFFAEAGPVVAAIWSKYAGKPYGEKTREKIRDEIKAAAGVYMYIKSGDFNISEIDADGWRRPGGYEITCGPKYRPEGGRPALLVDNKIQAINFDDLEILYINKMYFDDVPAAVGDMIKKLYAAQQIAKRLNEACAAFNVYAVGGGVEPISEKNISYYTL